MGIFGSKRQERAQARCVDTVIGAEAVFEGVLATKNSVCIDGTFRGSLRSEGSVILGRSGHIEADVVAERVEVNGILRGTVRALGQLDVGATGAIHGEVEAAAVTVARGGVLEGTCRRIAPSGEEAADANPAPQPATVEVLPRPPRARPEPAAGRVPAEA